MIRLRIDGQECDLYEDFTLPEKIVQLDVERLGELNAIRQGHSIEVEIPSTIKNDELMGYPTDTKSAAPDKELSRKGWGTRLPTKIASGRSELGGVDGSQKPE